jgi:hypothetical protein
MNYLLTCDRCENRFNEEDRMPMIFSECGHTFCEQCVGEIFKDDHKICPECGAKIRERAENQCRKNIKILNYLRKGIDDSAMS